MYTQLEDEFGDVVGKARRGQEIAVAALADRVGLTAGDIAKIEDYELVPTADTIERLAQALGLHPGKLQASAEQAFFPRHPAGLSITGAQVEMMVLGSGFLMNGYIVGCVATGQAAIIDPGFDADKILQPLVASGLTVEQILLTHGHQDHVSALAEIGRATSAPARIHSGDLALTGSLADQIAGELEEGEAVHIGKLRFEVRSTPGHTAGGISLVHEEMAFVGDALFAGSLGGTRSLVNYRMQRQAVAEKLLGLDANVALFPGHGPATTVGEEREYNPFFL
ncbi:MAG: MBL fold metallo-hydrolase [Gemmatimonadota bacterium]|nr:MBL fold metallo-hydrolase [Gemmatimonadota bacterium]